MNTKKSITIKHQLQGNYRIGFETPDLAIENLNIFCLATHFATKISF